MKKSEDESQEPDLKTMDEVIDAKLIDMETPGFAAEFDPLEADRIGAFEEDALSEQDAWESAIDVIEHT